MKNFIILILFLFISCGKSNQVNVDEKKQTESEDEKQEVLCLGCLNPIDVIIKVPATNLVGAVIQVDYLGKLYLIDLTTDPNIKNFINSLPPNDHTKKVKATFSKQKGLYPSPSVEYDVILIQEIIN